GSCPADSNAAQSDRPMRPEPPATSTFMRVGPICYRLIACYSITWPAFDSDPGAPSPEAREPSVHGTRATATGEPGQSYVGTLHHQAAWFHGKEARSSARAPCSVAQDSAMS